MANTGTQSTRRVNMRVGERQERTLRAAADASGQTLTAFVLGAATQHAEEVLARAHRLALDADAFARFTAALDGSPEPMPMLRSYAQSPEAIDPR